MNKLWLVANHTYKRNVFSKTFIMMILSPLIFFLIFGAVFFFIQKSAIESGTDGKIALVNVQEDRLQAFQKAAPEQILMPLVDEKAAQAALNKEEIDGYIIQDEKNIDHLTYYTQRDSKDVNLSPFTDAVNRQRQIRLAKDYQLSDQQIQALEEKVKIEKINVRFQDDGSSETESSESPAYFIKKGAAYAVNILIFFFVIYYVQIIAQEIAGEKGARVLEIVLSSISAKTHFFGKLLGIIGMLFTQVACYLLLGLLAFSGLYTPALSKVKDGLQEALQAIGGLNAFLHLLQPILLPSIIFALLGILLFTAFAGLLGSLASKIEDVNKLITPITLSAVVGFYIGLSALLLPNSLVVRIGSQIPIFTPFVMPFRIANETVATGALAISIVFMLLFTACILYLAAVFYKTNAITYSDKGFFGTMKASYQLWQMEHQAKNHQK